MMLFCIDSYISVTFLYFVEKGGRGRGVWWRQQDLTYRVEKDNIKTAGVPGNNWCEYSGLRWSAHWHMHTQIYVIFKESPHCTSSIICQDNIATCRHFALHTLNAMDIDSIILNLQYPTSSHNSLYFNNWWLSNTCDHPPEGRHKSVSTLVSLFSPLNLSIPVHVEWVRRLYIAGGGLFLCGLWHMYILTYFMP